MKQPKKSKSRENTAAIYLRISRDDGIDGDSNSIINQKKLLSKIAKERGYSTILTFSDDGISGVTMNRSGFNDMKDAIRAGKISAVFVKDSSRIGRNYIEVGEFVEIFLVEHDVRLVSVSDGVDTHEAEDELGSIRYVISDMYARDISKKVRIASQVKGNSGEPLGFPPFGYMKNPEKPKFWIIDPEAATIVRRIYDMSLDGMGTEQIAAALQKDSVITPTNYYLSKGIPRPGSKTSKSPDAWNSSSVSKILSVQEYCGDVVNFKTHSKSYKVKKRIENDREDWKIFFDVHEPIIERNTWEKVQQKRGKVRKRTQKNGERNVFSGILRCADCGGNMNFHFNQKNSDIEYFNCSNNNSCRKTCPTTHYIRVDFLEQAILGEIGRITKFAKRYERVFAEYIMGRSQETAADELNLKKKKLGEIRARDRELDMLYQRVYEDEASGKISTERFSKLARGYEQEQSELAGKIKALSSEIENASVKTVTAETFIATVRKYTRAKKLTPRMLNELIEHIEVYHAEKIDGVHVQRLTIHYHCAGEIVIPDVLKLPAPEVKIQTRRGVSVAYASNGDNAKA